MRPSPESGGARFPNARRLTMKAIAKTLAAALVGMAMAGAPILAQTVTIDYDHTVNFLKFKTYTWEKIHATDPDVESRITLAMKRDRAEEEHTSELQSL